jgi:hypothetical protein
MTGVIFALSRFGLLPRLRHRAANRLAHHPPVHAELLRYPFDRSHALFVFTPDLLQ